MLQAEQPSATSNKGVTRALVAVFLVYFTSYAVMNLLTVTLPKMAAELNGMALYSWAVAAPSLASAFVTLIFGKLSDLYGRRIILLVSLGFFLLGSVLSAVSQTFIFLIVARSILGLGQGALAALCFSVLGDLFDPVERGKWGGLLNIPSGLAALVGPTLGGYIMDTWGWRLIFWLSVPLLVLSVIAVLIGVPSLKKQAAHKIDFLGSVILAVASSTMLLGFSWAGAMYPWGSIQIIGLLGSSVVFWALFIWVESKAEEPMLDPQLLTNRTFMIASMSGLLSLFGLVAIMVYFPLFHQGVQGLSGTLSGQILTPFSVLMGFMGIFAGLLLAKTKRYKWMYLVGYAIMVGAMFLLWSMNAQSPVWMSFLVSTVMGLGIGTIPTINTLVVQYAVPKRLLGVATGGIYFFVMIGMAIAPAILGSAMNSVYAKNLAAELPAELPQVLDEATLASLNDPRMLLSPPVMAALEESFNALGDNGPALFTQTVEAVRSSLEAGLKAAFLIGAITMVLSFLLILAIPEISIEMEVEDKRAPAAAPAS
ncbi:MAG: MFS transporter [Anaerolineae bacterium]|nr:MFS transporter [Anaerolineae bacterium]